jgi:acetate kinase
MPLMILNAGSSSLKFTLMESADQRVWMEGTLELDAAGPADAGAGAGGDAAGSGEDTARYAEALRRIIADVRRRDASLAIDAVAHRVVHGGARFTAPVHITRDVRAALAELNELAPLHNPPSLAVIDAAISMLPDVPHIAVFDTAFHATLAPEAYVYPLPHEWTERWGLRRFGFHGLSHAYAAQRAAEMLGRAPDGLHVIVAHLGNGASVTAVRSNASVDTTMGFTPLEGLMMGTRSGSIDPGLLLYLQRACGLSVEDLDHGLNKESGLLGVSGVSSDMREVLTAATSGDERAALAVRLFSHRARQAIGAMAVTLGRVDALVFTGGIGEHSRDVRAAICEGLSCVGLELDARANHEATPDAVISTPDARDSRARILVVAAREDITIARAVTSLVSAR